MLRNNSSIATPSDVRLTRRWSRIVLPALLLLSAVLLVFAASDRSGSLRSKDVVDVLTTAPFHSDRLEFAFVSTLLPSDSGLPESSRLRLRGGVGSRLSGAARVGRGGSSSERRIESGSSFRGALERFGLALKLFERLWLEKTSPRPIWLFLLVLLN